MSGIDLIQDCAASGQPLSDAALVIDAHAHLGRTAMIHTHAPDAAGLVASMDRIGIRTTCLSSLVALAGDTRRGNDEAAEAARRYPGRFAAYAVINPNDPGPVEAELERCLGAGTHWAVKIHPTFHAYPSDGPAYRQVYAWLNERGGVLLSHIFETPAVLAGLCRLYSRVTFLMAHAGGYDGRATYPFAAALREHPNAFADITLSTVPFGGLEALAEQCGAGKLLFASDVPFLDNAHQVGRVTHARLSLEEKRMILGGNMAKILGGRMKMDGGGPAREA